jgi:hypothetical protein
MFCRAQACAFVLVDGTLAVVGGNNVASPSTVQPVVMGGLAGRPIKKVDFTSGRMLALASDGTLWYWEATGVASSSATKSAPTQLSSSLMNPAFTSGIFGSGASSSQGPMMMITGGTAKKKKKNKYSTTI